MTTSHTIAASLLLLAATGCQEVSSDNTAPTSRSGGENAGSAEDERVADIFRFEIQVGDTLVKTTPAIIAVEYPSKAPAKALLQFSADHGPASISLVAPIPYEALLARSAELSLDPIGSRGESGTLLLEGSLVSSATMTLDIDDGGGLTGEISGVADPIRFSGPFILNCAVPAGAIDSELQAPKPTDSEAAEVLIVDSDFRSDQCKTVRQTLGL